MRTSVCSEYEFWGTLVAEVDPAARPAAAAAFDVAAAEQLLIRAFEDTARTTLTAAALKGKMVALDSSFDERNHGCRSFRDFLDRFPGRVRRAGNSGSEITLELARERDACPMSSSAASVVITLSVASPGSLPGRPSPLSPRTPGVGLARDAP